MSATVRVIAALLAALTFCFVVAHIRRATTSTSSLQWGMFAGAGSVDAAALPSLVGKTPIIVATFVGWPDSFPTEFASACANGQTLLVFWENFGYSIDSIIAGKHDAYIASFAQDAQQASCPVIIAPFHEANLSDGSSSWGGYLPGNTPANIIDAWKHIHDLFVEAGTANVKFAWVMNSGSIPDVAGNQFDDYYPGDDYVDYVGVDGFNFGRPWQTVSEVFDTAVAKLQKYRKPIYLFSVGCTAGPRKAAWITEGLGMHVPTYPNVRGWVWFNERKNGHDWRIDSDSSSLRAFRAALP